MSTPMETSPLYTTVLYFASLQSMAGLDQEQVPLEQTDNPAKLYARLRQSRGLSLPQSALRVAINDCFADWETPLQADDRVAFLPPMSGG